MFIKEFARVIEETFPNAPIFVDLFGGSGLLSRTIKDTLPHAEVVYNDYDDYSTRLAHIPLTNAILADIRLFVKNEKRQQKLSGHTKKEVCDYLHRRAIAGDFVDCLTLSASLLFSGKFAKDIETLCAGGMYNTVVQRDYTVAEDYLKGLTVTRLDYRELVRQYKNIPGVVFIADPPYMFTDKKSYNGYWGIAECLDVLKVLGDNFVYFTSSKSEIIELTRWIEGVTGWSPLRNTRMITRRNEVNGTTGYIDIMAYKSSV